MARVLVVDDVADNVKLLEYDLVDVGHEVITAFSGREALTAVDTQPIDCILLDIMMPEMNGYQVCRRLKADPETQSIPVIMVSANCSEKDVIEGLDAGADDYITKPFNSRIVEARVRAALRIKKAHDAIANANNSLEEARRNAESTNRLKSEFLANMSHELRTPLNAVIGFSEGLLERIDRHPLNDHQLDRLTKILNSGRHLLSLINDVLDIAKLESGKVQISISTFDPALLVHEIGDLATGLLKAKPQVVFQVSLDESIPTIASDREKLKQILINLVGNAIKFTWKGSVTLRFQYYSDQYLFSVEDTGPGIPPGELPKIFNKFHQVQQTKHRSIKGTGLGLSICKGFANLLDGELQVQTIEGEGSVFTLILPSLSVKVDEDLRSIASE